MDIEKNSCVHFAAKHSFHRLLKLYIENENCDLTIINQFGVSAYECAERVDTRKLFPEYKKAIFMSKYQRHIIGNQVIKNGRADHVKVMLIKVKHTSSAT